MSLADDNPLKGGLFIDPKIQPPIQQEETQIPDSEEDDDDSDTNKKQSRLKRIGKKRGWYSFTILLGTGIVVLGGPAIVLASLDPNTLPYLSNEGDPLLLQSSSYQVVRYSIWMSATWIIWVLSAFLTNALPSLIVAIVTFIFGECSERIRQKLDLIPAVKSWGHATIALAGSLVVHILVFYQRDLVPIWGDVLKLVISLLIIAIVLFLQRMFVQNLAYNFHLVSYKDRIAQSNYELEILDLLKRAIRAFGLANIFSSSGESGTRSLNLGDSRILPKFLRTTTKVYLEKDAPVIVEVKSVAESKVELIEMKSVMQDELRSRLSTPEPRIDGSLKRNISHETGAKSLNNPTTSTPKPQDGLAIGKRNRKIKKNFELYGEKHAIALAHELFYSLDPGVQVITATAFEKYIDDDALAKEAFRIFDKDGDGSVTLGEFELTVRRIYGEKRALNDSLGDLSEALGNLNKCLYVFSGLASILCAFPVWGISINAILPFTSLLLALSFVFGASARKTFDCIIFLFVSHPFDSGDLIRVDNQYYTVLEQSILQTTLTVEGKIIYIPNRNIFLSKMCWRKRLSSMQGGPIIFKRYFSSMSICIPKKKPWTSLRKML